MLEHALQFVPVFVLVVFRLGGMALYAPLFGSAKIPKRVRVMLVLVLALGMTPVVRRPVVLPDTPWALAMGIAGEIIFGLAMGTVMSMVFIACQWAGEIIGQQMGFNLSEVFDPTFGAQGSIIGDAYFMLTLVVFLLVGGHRAMLQGVYASFQILPLLSPGVDESLLHLMVGLFMSATVLAIQLSAPMLVATLVVDLVVGLIGKTLPQMNVLQVGITLRTVVGMVVVLIGLGLTVEVIRGYVLKSMMTVWNGWNGVIVAP
ncbi:MAG TPA: flagellar biosynthetic protein FliR [Tepidisphaeraceae bacterium]|jgi:flagellar biosynthetic protein FliR|nr:flagellar biosynthetic protein FliR [Tepidisphaeraceae bacterium]